MKFNLQETPDIAKSTEQPKLRLIMVKVRKWQLPRPQTLIIASPKMYYLTERKKVGIKFRW